MAMAVATPARLPVPTLVATETAKAWKEDMCLWFLLLLSRPFVSETAESANNLNISPTMRNCPPLVFHVNHIPHSTNTPVST